MRVQGVCRHSCHLRIRSLRFDQIFRSIIDTGDRERQDFGGFRSRWKSMESMGMFGLFLVLEKSGPKPKMRTPGVEPGSQAWEACMMPLHYVRSCNEVKFGTDYQKSSIEARHRIFAATTDAKKAVHQPGIEPGSHRWQRCILPLDH